MALGRTVDTLRVGGSPVGRAGLPARLPEIVVTAVVATAAVVAFFVVRSTVADQEQRILQERTGEVGVILQNAFGTVESQLSTLGVAARIGDPAGKAFTREAAVLARTTATPGAPRTFALVRRSGDRYVVAAAAGPGLKLGEVLAGPRRAIVARALADPKLQGSSVFRRNGQPVLGFALGPPAAPSGSAVYLGLPIFPATVTPPAANGPFHELDLALYASPRPNPAQLVLRTTRQIPLPGRVASIPVAVGPLKWLLVASPREPLVGSFARAVPWLLLGIGLVGALLAGLVAYGLERRRDYAFALVDERTGELESSLRALREAQERLVLQQRLAAIGQVAAAVGHELRNPLGVMTNALYLLRMQLSPDEAERVRRHLDTTEREIAATTAIVESLLGFARERRPMTESVDIAELLSEALSVVPPPAGVQIVRQGLESLPFVEADRQQLRQVILNLVTNAYEAMNGEGVLTVGARVADDAVEIRFGDTGPGLGEASASEIFEPFFTRKAKGIGLGLAVTKQIVEAHRGAIVVESSPGTGATFVVRLPNAAVVDEVGR